MGGLNPVALRKAKIVYNFGLSECNRVKRKEFTSLEVSSFHFEKTCKGLHCQGNKQEVKICLPLKRMAEINMEVCPYNLITINNNISKLYDVLYGKFVVHI